MWFAFLKRNAQLMNLNLVRLILKLQIPAELSTSRTTESGLLVVLDPNNPSVFHSVLDHDRHQHNDVFISYIDRSNVAWRHWFSASMPASIPYEYQSLVKTLPDSLSKYLPYIQRSILHTCGIDVLKKSNIGTNSNIKMSWI